MKTISATDASRSFAAVLDEVEHGETIVITRAGRRVAQIAPATLGNGRLVVDLIASSGFDIEYADDVRAARTAVRAEEPAWPAD